MQAIVMKDGKRDCPLLHDVHIVMWQHNGTAAAANAASMAAAVPMCCVMTMSLLRSSKQCSCAPTYS
jgi:hypothetical protein